jgi:hypothetical protein
MKNFLFFTFTLMLAIWSTIPFNFNNTESPNAGTYNSPKDESTAFDYAGLCDSVTIFTQQLRTVPASCCFQLIINNKLRNAITQIKLDINTATFTNIVVEVNAGWIVSQTLQKDILLSHSSGFIPLGGSSPLTFCLKGGNNPDSLKISFSYSALGTSGTCSINSLLCSDPLPCDADFTFGNINSCGNVQFTNQSTGSAPLTYSWTFGDPGSGSGNLSNAQNPNHQFTACGMYLVCLKTSGSGCTDSICKTVSYIDNVKPVITCPPFLNLACNINTNPPASGVATATDNCTPANSILITSSDLVTGVMPCNATITRTWSAKDGCGNISTCPQRITIKDTIAPGIICPSNAVVNTNPGVCYFSGPISQPTGVDNCSQNVTFTCSLITPTSSILITSQTQFPKGVNTITCFAKDGCGNQSQNCNFSLTVVDNEKPKIICPSNLSLIGTINPQGTCTAIVSNLAPTVTDNCPMTNLSYLLAGATSGQGNGMASNLSFLQGITTVTYYVTDMAGNRDSCKFTVTVTCVNSLTCPNNLVPNPSFESYTICPPGISPPFTATGWTLPTGGTSDLYNSCAPISSNVNAPQNSFGLQNPRTGNGYAGFILRPSNPNYREYLEVPLTATLTAGHTYQVSFYLSLADQAKWAIDKIGAFLSPTSVGPIATAPVLPYTPQIMNPIGNYITNKTGWTLISGNYVATGVETHLVIGNFYNDALTIPLMGQGGFYPGSYYYIDDVSVCESCVSPPCDTCCKDAMTFNALVNQGFTVVNQDCQVTVTAPQFDSCFLFSTPPVLDGGIASQVITNPNGSWTYTFTQSGTHQVCVTVFDACQVKQMCTTVKVNCPIDYCDSISFWVESLKAIPPACCFRLHVDNKAKNKFTQIPLVLNTAQFNSISVDNFNGWIASQSNPGNINLSNNVSGFIPVGSFTPLSWCIYSGSNPDTISVKAEFLVGHTKVTCDTSFVFFCPPQPDTACGIGCKADSILLNTGVDHSTGLFYAPGSPDPYWTVTQTPYPAYSLPKPAYVLATPSYWHDQPNASMPCSRWINFSGGPYHYDGGIYEFTRCFCICKDGARIQIHLSALVDNKVDFTLCDSTGTTLAQLLSSSTFLRPPADTTVSLLLDKGRYCIKASVSNYGHTYTGLNVCGSIKGDGLVKEICCEPSSIIGVKYLDTSCVGLSYNGGQPTLQGWQIVLCNNQGVAIDTVITDPSGAYSFSPLLPGLYTLKEINQSGWTPSLPSSGISSIFLGANQVAQVNFANCPPEKDSCCMSKATFGQNILNAVHFTIADSICKAKITVQRLPLCDSILLINWGDGQITNGAFANGMWMHTYTQSGTYTIQIPIVEYGANGKPCFDTLLSIPIEIHCVCECGRYLLGAAQNGFVTPLSCNDTLTLGCPASPSLSINGHFTCAGDSCVTPNIQWTLSGPSVNLSGSTSPGNIQINIPGPLNAGYYVLNLQTVCGQQKCTCKITIFQRPCPVIDTCNMYCSGTSWSQLNTSWIEDMVVFQGKLIVAGQFSSIGNPLIQANNIAAWNGSVWAPLGNGLNNMVKDIEVHNGILYAGGDFTMAGNTSANKIASWNGSSWSALPQGGINGVANNVEALLSSAWGLVVGGKFNAVGSSALTANNIARWNPVSGWATFGSGLNGPVFALSHFNGNIVAGGHFGNSPGGLNNLAIWVGYWTKVGGGGAVTLSTPPIISTEGIYAITQYKNDLIVGGQFPSAVSTTVLNGTKTQHLAQWNGAYWTTIGIGPNPPGSSINTGNGVFALKVINNELLVGGQFSQINGQNIAQLAKWNGTSWSGFGHPANGIVKAIAVSDSGVQKINCNLYTGGEVLFNQWKCSSVSAADKSQPYSISIYPNPSKGKIYIQFNEALPGRVQISLYSLIGQQVADESFENNHFTKSIDIHSLPAATYLVKISTAKGHIVKKIIVVE